MQEEILIISHIPKTAGTSIRIHLQKHMNDQVDFIHLANKGHKWAAEKGLKPFPERTAEQRNQAKVIFGHQVNYQTKHLVSHKKPVEIVYFRDPIKWEISRFNQYNNHMVNINEKTVSFASWINEVEKVHSQFDWFIANYLYLKGELKKLSAQAKQHLLWSTLDQFDFVLFTESFDQSSQILFDRLKVPKHAEKANVVGLHKKNYFSFTEQEENMINELCKDEVVLYNQLKAAFETPDNQ
ncbi:MAG: hypothetical protein ACSHWU_00175 [Marinicella sp.]